MYVCMYVCMHIFLNGGQAHLLLIRLIYILYHLPVYCTFICFCMTNRIKEHFCRMIVYYCIGVILVH
jgi:hypothetical protein